MKLAPRSFRIEWDLHAWAGVVSSLFLFVIFYCGVFALFTSELEVWQEPARHVAPVVPSRVSFDRVLSVLRAHEDIPRGARVGLDVHAGTRSIAAYVTRPGADEGRPSYVDPVAGTLSPERSRLASELYFLHFFYRVPGGMEASGVLAIALLVALVSGLVIHWKDLRRQWWQFRPARRLRFSSSDAHKVLGIFGLPFTAVLAWSGAVLCLAGLVGSGVASTNFHGDAERVAILRGRSRPSSPPTGTPAPMLSLDELVERARAAVPGAKGPVRHVDIQQLDDQAASVRVYFETQPLAGDEFAALDAVSGAVRSTSVSQAAPAGAFERFLFDLHFARYGGLLLKALYALLALATCAVLVTGNVVWLERRDPKRERLGNRLLERLTLGASGGLVLASAAYLAANRMVPAALARRAQIELWCFLAIWASVTAVALLRAWQPRRWNAGLGAAASALFALAVVLDVARMEANLFTATALGLPAIVVADSLLLGLSVVSGTLAWASARGASGSPGRSAG